MEKIKNNEAPPEGYSFIYMTTFYCDNGKPCFVYIGKTDGPIEARIGKRLSDSYYESAESYNIPVHKAIRLMGLDSTKTEILAVVRTEFAETIEHLFIWTYSNICINVQNRGSNTIDTNKLGIQPWIILSDENTKKPVDVFENIDSVEEYFGLDNIMEINEALMNKTPYGGFYWSFAKDYEIDDNTDNLYRKKSRVETVNERMLKCLREN